jgi:hypothetical protein
MTTIEIDPRRRDADVAAEVKRALEALRQGALRRDEADQTATHLGEKLITYVQGH